MKEQFGNTFDGVTALVTSLLPGYKKHLLSPGNILPALLCFGLQGQEDEEHNQKYQGGHLSGGESVCVHWASIDSRKDVLSIAEI